MVVYFSAFVEGDRTIYTTACQRCGAIIGDLDGGEVGALASGKYGPVLCFECEEKSCSCCHKELNSQDDQPMADYGVCWFCVQTGGIPVGRNMPDWSIDVSFTLG